MATNEEIIPTKAGLWNLAEERGNVSKACLSRETGYSYKNAMQAGGAEALLDKSRQVINRKNRVDERIEQAPVAQFDRAPGYGSENGRFECLRVCSFSTL